MTVIMEEVTEVPDQRVVYSSTRYLEESYLAPRAVCLPFKIKLVSRSRQLP